MEEDTSSWTTSSSSSSSFLQDHGSAVLYDDENGTGGRIRIAHLLGLLPVTRPERGAFQPLDSRVFYILGGYIALKHFNERSNKVIKNLSELIGDDCNIQLSIEYRDTQYSKSVGAKHIQEVLQQWPENSLPKVPSSSSQSQEEEEGGGGGGRRQPRPFPAAIIGAGRSDVSETVNTLSGIYSIPQVSPHSSAASLDDKGRYPYFARTTPSSSADGKSAVDYFHSMGVSHFGVIYVLDVLGSSYNEDIRREASILDMTVESVPYNHLDGIENIQRALGRLKNSGVRYLFAVIEPSTWKEFIRIAIAEEMIGTSDTFWLFHSGMVGLVPEELDKIYEYDLARAIHGSGVLLKNFPPNPALDELLLDYESDTTKQQDFVSKWGDPSIFDGFEFRYPGDNYPQYINYDAVISLGLAACRADKELFNGDDLYKSLLQLRFEGASSYVSFDNATGTRDSVPFQVDNILMIDKGNNTLGFVQDPAALIDGLGQITTLKEFVYWDNTTTVPLSLPATTEHDLNLIPTSLRAVGLAFGALTILVSILCAGWVLHARSSVVVKYSQPFFLLQLCLGCFIMASAIIPMSMQEPIRKPVLDIACMSTPWLLCCGYSIAFSALVAKMWRINKLFASGRQFRRVKISIAGASWPLAILLTVNVLLLTVWTVIAPLEWVRVPLEDSVDKFGRPRESYGSCASENETIGKVMVSILAVVNSIGLIFTNFQGLKTRSLPMDFNEARYLAISNACILEVLVLGIPILILADDSPSASFMCKSIMTAVLCLCILLPMFVPKYIQRNMQQRVKERASASMQRSTDIVTNNSSTLGRSSVRVSGLLDSDLMPIIKENELNNDNENGKEDEHSYKLLIVRHKEYYVQRNLPSEMVNDE